MVAVTPPNRVLHEAEVVAVRDLAPHMRRITVRGEGLREMAVTLPGQWMKVFIPAEPGCKAHGRAYTIRRHDPATGMIDLDFVLHGDGGRASAWATRARTGDILSLAGPREGYAIDPARTAQYLVGDSTALPAMAGILEALPPAVTAYVVLEVSDSEEGGLLPSRPNTQLTLLTSGDRPAGSTGQIEKTVFGMPLPPASQAWIAGEATMMRTVLAYLVDACSMDRHAVSASGYWRMGVEDHRDTRL